ncbi:MAG: hypothetical protein NC251_04705 [Lachnoclostridium sp.]|nr:hypothetical protein [Lachnospira sp.]MCM1247713.1 hypothetical protein [Lachnoclostridium sp.]MCM1535743.1 hypothetical protein [Clostridium sp.]
MSGNAQGSGPSLKQISLKNNEGRILTVTLRQYLMGDEEGMIACIRDEYGETYFKRGFYCPEYIQKESKSGHITFLVAETKSGEIAGILILKEFYPEETMCEVASEIFRKKYRGYGLAMPFFEYGMEILLSRSYSAAFCLPVLFHDVTQRLLGRLGLHACGFVLNVFDMDKITHSYHNGKNTKHSQGVQIRMTGKQNAGIVYAPQEHRAYCYRIYDRLGAGCQLATGRRTKGENLPLASDIGYCNDSVQSSLEIYVYGIGADLPTAICELHKKYPLSGRQTANIFLNCSDAYAPWAYEELTKLGYFFTGLKPLCSEKEYMILHHPGEVRIYFEDYAVDEEFAPLLAYVRRCYVKSGKGGFI